MNTRATFFVLLLSSYTTPALAHECTTLLVEGDWKHDQYDFLANHDALDRDYPYLLADDLYADYPQYYTSDNWFNIYFHSTHQQWVLRNGKNNALLAYFGNSIRPYTTIEKDYTCLRREGAGLPIGNRDCHNLLTINCANFEIDSAPSHAFAPTNLLMSTDLKQITAANFDDGSHEAVVDNDGHYLSGFDLIMKDQYSFFVTQSSTEFVDRLDVDGSLILTGDTSNDKILQYDVNGDLIRTMANVASPMKMLDIGNGQILVLTNWVEEYGTSVFHVMDAETGEITKTVLLRWEYGGYYYPRYLKTMCLGRTDDEILLIDWVVGGIYLASVSDVLDTSDSGYYGIQYHAYYRSFRDPSAASSSSFDRDYDLSDVGFIRKTGQILALDRHRDNFVFQRIYSCDFGFYNCFVWFRSSPYDEYDMTSIDIDEEKELVYVSDHAKNRVLVFTFEGVVPIRTLAGKPGDLSGPLGMVRRPGVFGPLSMVVTSEDEISAIAGEEVVLPLDLRDDFDRTIGSEYPDVNRFTAYAVGDVEVNGELVEVTFDQEVGTNPGTNEYILLSTITSVGNFSLHVKEGSGTMVHNSFKNSPLKLTISAGDTSASDTTYGIENTGDNSRLVTIQTRDIYSNPTSNTDDSITFFIGEDDPTEINEKQFSIERKRFFRGFATLHILVNGVEINDGIDVNFDGMSPTLFTVILISVSAVIAGSIFRVAVNQRRARKVHEKNEGRLKDKLKKKSHSKEEQDVMKKALEELSDERGSELRGVLVKSEYVNVESVLGKGGFGIVNLGTYTDPKTNKVTTVAIKQLLEIDEESVERFRFECFLMKTIRHPNIVELVGVCWDDMMLACLLEFVSNGSLEDHLRKDKASPYLTWGKQLLKIMTECAMGVQYLHKTRYYDEKENNGEGEWKDCIVHRDLKPDNMLLMDDWTLKLTDFGEARAVDLNLTMTQVGTPIFVAPEIMVRSET
mgnify:FL=1